jgi:hypothetical protein
MNDYMLGFLQGGSKSIIVYNISRYYIVLLAYIIWPNGSAAAVEQF